MPEGTKSFVMLMTDPEGRGVLGVVHWVAYGIPSLVTGLRKAKKQAIRQLRWRQEHSGVGF